MAEETREPISEKAKQIIKQVLTLLNEIRDELPPIGKAAIGGLASILGYGKAPRKEEIAYFIGQLVEIKEVGARLSAATKDVLKRVIAMLTELLGEPYTYPSVCYPRKYPNYLYYPPYPEKAAGIGEELEFFESSAITKNIDEVDGSVWEICVLKAGLSKNKTYYPIETLQAALPLFDNVRVHADHPTPTEERERPIRSVRTLLGYLKEPRLVDSEIRAKFHVVDEEFKKKLLNMWEQKALDLIGFSVNLSVLPPVMERVNGDYRFRVDKIVAVKYVDAVTEPAAGGRLIAVLESAMPAPTEITAESREGGERMVELETLRKENEDLKRRLEALERNLKISALNEILSNAKLHEKTKARIRSQFENRDFTREEVLAVVREEEQIQGEIAQQPPYSRTLFNISKGQITPPDFESKVNALANLFYPGAVKDAPAYDSLRQAYADFKSVPIWSVHPLQIIREGTSFSSEVHVMETIDQTNWGHVIGLAMTRALLAAYRVPYLDDYKKIVHRVTRLPHTKTQERIRTSGYGPLPLVSYGETIPTAGPAASEKVTYEVLKYAIQEPITDKVVMDDDLGAIQELPVKFARAAKRRIYDEVFSWIKDNKTVTYDGKPLFCAEHGNLGNSPLSYDSLSAAKAAMFLQAEYGAPANILGLKPRYLLVPAQLYATAEALRTSEHRPGAAGHEINIHRNTFETIVVATFTDPNDWALVADPQDIPTIELGFLHGRDEPIIETEHPQAGASFAADKLTFKVKLIFGVGLLDHRGFWKAEVP